MVMVSICVCRGRGLMYRYQLQSYAKLIGVLKVIVYALLLNGISSSTSIAQVGLGENPTAFSSVPYLQCDVGIAQSPLHVIASDCMACVAERIGLMM